MFRKHILEVLAAVLLGGVAAVPSAWSQYDPLVRQSQMDQSMSTFMGSIEKILAENRKLVDTNADLRAKIKAMRDQIKALKNDETRLVVQLNKVDTHYQKRRGSVVGLQNSLADDLQALAGLKNERLMVTENLKSKDIEDRDLQNKLETLVKGTLDPATGGSTSDPAARLTALQSERAALENDLAAAKGRVASLKSEWQTMSVAVNSGGGQTKVFEKEKARLKAELSRKEDAVNALRQQAGTQERLLGQLSSEASAEAFFAKKQSEGAALDLELQALQREVSTLEEKNALTAQKEDVETPRRKKKEELLKDLSVRNISLRSELARTQQEMVTLDKMKSSLEKSLYQPKY